MKLRALGVLTILLTACGENPPPAPATQETADTPPAQVAATPPAGGAEPRAAEATATPPPRAEAATQTPRDRKSVV